MVQRNDHLEAHLTIKTLLHLAVRGNFLLYSKSRDGDPTTKDPTVVVGDDKSNEDDTKRCSARIYRVQTERRSGLTRGDGSQDGQEAAAHKDSPGWLKRTGSSSQRLTGLVEEDRQQLTQAHGHSLLRTGSSSQGSPGWLVRTGGNHTGSPGLKLLGTGSS
ncbi:hypothetical protein RRG08_048716 [Elysia crispata]|uniref:Uncharacterized protein n=1 Tax=Elysia crispata TaxID=231223 RepID=A0AAE1ALS0_9GAST|nr:hypothetical protein RRG08_048716 [Elysia crispata]